MTGDGNVPTFSMGDDAADGIGQQQPGQPGPNEWPDQHPAGQPMGGQYPGGQFPPVYGYPGFWNPGRPKPDSYLVWAILSTLFCCTPFGIVSIVFAAKVDGLWTQGRFEEADRASASAKMWAVVAASVYGGLIALYIVVVAIVLIVDAGS